MVKRDKKQHGGAREGAGRKPLSDNEPSVVVNLKMTAGQRDKLRGLGGAPWVRERIDRAKTPG